MALNTPDQKAQADTALLSGFSAMAGQKVQLDIDDAPFLDEPEKEAPPPPAPVQKKEPAKAAPKEEPKKSKKKLIIAVLALVLLAALAAVLYLMVFSKEEPPGPPVIVVTPPPPPPPGPEIYNITLEPFMVELRDAEGVRRFLTVSLILSTKNVIVNLEAQDKIIVLRDSVYYYLRNQTYEFLRNPVNTEKVRQDLISAVNEYMVQGDMDDVLFDSYLIR